MMEVVLSARLRRAVIPYHLRGSSVGALLLRLEVRRSAAIWLLPLLAVVFWLNAYRSAMATLPLWDVRGLVMADHIVEDFTLFGARIAILFGVTASQHAWGSPPWWPSAVGAAVGLAGTARLAPDRVGYLIPAFGDAAADGLIPYTPVCQASPVDVCVNPAFRAQLPALDSELAPFFAELAGLPGAPVRAQEIPAVAGSNLNWNGRIGGTPPTYQFALPDLGSLAGVGGPVIVTFIGGNSASGGTPAPQAVERALLRAAGSDEGASWPVPAAVAVAAGRFAALPAAARRAWLGTHLAALRAGHVTLGEL